MVSGWEAVVLMIRGLRFTIKGGEHSGHHGHAGRPGFVGGSIPGGGGNILNSLSNDLYHVTKFDSAINIMKYDYFRTTEGMTGESRLSTTTDPSYFWGPKDVRFVLDPTKLAEKYTGKRIQETIYTTTGSLLQESEIGILSNAAIVNVHKYIKVIEYNPHTVTKDFMITLNGYSNKYNIPISILSLEVPGGNES